MTPTEPRSDDRDETTLPRRRFVAVGAGVGATLLAGCSTAPVESGGSDGSPSGESDGSSGDAGTFRLLISDRPADIDDFDSLEVTFEWARIFRGGDEDGDGEDGADEGAAGDDGGDEDGDGEESGTQTQTQTTETASSTTAAGTPTGTDAGTTTALSATATPDGTAADDDDGADPGGDRGFFSVDLDGATVDLTQVVGEKAVGVFEGELPQGRYTKVELHAADVGGVVDGEPADVKLPSGKLQITKPFEVVAGETLSFVFDINVVKKGQGSEYNLLPVISESGVAGQDVDVEEVGVDGGAGTAGTETGEGAGDGGQAGGPPDGNETEGGGPPDDAGGGS